MEIRALINNSGKTRAEIIAQVGLSPAYLSMLESGERSVGKKYLTALADCLGVTPATLRPDLAALIKHGNAPAQDKGAA